MIIDAMDMLYTSELEGFCLVSSDSDFTKLASRLRESGRMVIGMGESKTPAPFRKACDIFTELELLLEDNTLGNTVIANPAVKGEKQAANAAAANGNGSGNSENKSSRKASVNAVGKNQIEEAVVKIITENQNNDKETGLGEVGSRLVKLYPDFDVRRYGYSLLSKFLETFPKLKLKQDGTQVTVMLYEDKSKKEMLEEYLMQQIISAGAQGISLGTLGNRIRNKFGDFKVRDYGYSQFKQYVQSFENVRVEDDGEQNWAVYQR